MIVFKINSYKEYFKMNFFLKTSIYIIMLLVNVPIVFSSNEKKVTCESVIYNYIDFNNEYLKWKKERHWDIEGVRKIWLNYIDQSKFDFYDDDELADSVAWQDHIEQDVKSIDAYSLDDCKFEHKETRIIWYKFKSFSEKTSRMYVVYNELGKIKTISPEFIEYESEIDLGKKYTKINRQ